MLWEFRSVADDGPHGTGGMGLCVGLLSLLVMYSDSCVVVTELGRDIGPFASVHTSASLIASAVGLLNACFREGGGGGATDGALIDR